MFYSSLLIISLSAISVLFNNEFAGGFLAAVMGLLATRLYYIIVTVFVGVKMIMLDLQGSLNFLWQVRATELLGAITLYSLGYHSVFFFILPFIVITFMIDITVTLLKLGIIELNQKNPDDEDENEDA